MVITMYFIYKYIVEKFFDEDGCIFQKQLGICIILLKVRGYFTYVYDY